MRYINRLFTYPNGFWGQGQLNWGTEWRRAAITGCLRKCLKMYRRETIQRETIVDV